MNFIKSIQDDKRMLPSRIFKKFGLFKHYVHLENVVLYVNTVCNAKCKFCDIGIGNKGVGIARLETKQYMTTDFIEQLLNDKAILNKRLSFNLIMTEPLLSPNISEIVSLIKKYGHSVLITTNGYLLKKKANELVLAGVDRIQVSIDGTSQFHNTARGINNLYEKALDGINEIKKLNENIHVRVNTTVTPFNYKDLVELADDLNSHVVIDRLKFQMMNFVTEQMSILQNKDTPFPQTISSVTDEDELNTINPTLLIDQYNKLRNNLHNYTNISSILFIPGFNSHNEVNRWFKTIEPLHNNDKCYLPFKQIAVKPNGEVTWHMRCYDYVIGNLLETSLDNIFYYSDKAKLFRNHHQSNNFCMPACSRCCGVTTSGK